MYSADARLPGLDVVHAFGFVHVGPTLVISHTSLCLARVIPTTMRSSLFISFVFAAASAQHDPIPKKQVETFEIDLDASPESRWAHVVTSKRAAIVTSSGFQLLNHQGRPS